MFTLRLVTKGFLCHSSRLGILDFLSVFRSRVTHMAPRGSGMVWRPRPPEGALPRSGFLNGWSDESKTIQKGILKGSKKSAPSKW